MKAFHRLYTRAVLWLLSLVAKDAVEIIYKHGQEDGMTELRAFMRRDLEKVYAATSVERMRCYNRGFCDAMRLYGDEPDKTPIERVM
jgi:hypothetical protein